MANQSIDGPLSVLIDPRVFSMCLCFNADSDIKGKLAFMLFTVIITIFMRLKVVDRLNTTPAVS